ncbi:FadR/GntR family transcriptional regulator [Gudongella oleilytica]|uniref:FadR/GntR family transcriptional regulator n=1 Tax=Gudongella oleilytica TaxID=1582259 RepID=UPI0023EA4D53|nr:FadR/GntR family transcriptional regulator [Gudongella oleilytica]
MYQRYMTLVTSGELKVGDKLPAERVLTERFGVSRATIREAISALEIMGLVEVKSGLGTFVAECKDTAEDEFYELTENDGISPTEIFEARIIIEPQLAKLASQRATQEDLDRLKDVVEETEVLSENQIEEFEVLDEQFHSIIANAAYNDVLLKFAQNINKLRGSKLWGNMKYKSLQKEGRITRYKVEHKAIYLALVNRDFNEVESLTKKHLIDIKADIFDDVD